MLAHLILYSRDSTMLIVGGLLLIVFLFLFAVWVLMIIDAIKYSKDDGGGLRLILLFLFGSIYGIIYYFTVYRKRKETDTSSNYSVPE